MHLWAGSGLWAAALPLLPPSLGGWRREPGMLPQTPWTNGSAALLVAWPWYCWGWSGNRCQPTLQAGMSHKTRRGL